MLGENGLNAAEKFESSVRPKRGSDARPKVRSAVLQTPMSMTSIPALHALNCRCFPNVGFRGATAHGRRVRRSGIVTFEVFRRMR